MNTSPRANASAFTTAQVEQIHAMIELTRKLAAAITMTSPKGRDDIALIAEHTGRSEVDVRRALSGL
jgi:hypothetical protein